VASTLSAFGGVVLATASAFDDAQRERLQLKDAVTSRAVVDQAKGILMHALGCDAAEALDRIRRVSQRRHIKVTRVAGQIVEAHGGAHGGALPGQASAPGRPEDPSARPEGPSARPEDVSARPEDVSARSQIPTGRPEDPEDPEDPQDLPGRSPAPPPRPRVAPARQARRRAPGTRRGDGGFPAS
jgi:hypothetical protein